MVEAGAENRITLLTGNDDHIVADLITVAELEELTVEDLESYRERGLTRIHIGMETGHDPLLEIIRKGGTAALHIKGGRKVVDAGLELSEYLIPGLGGREMSDGHARDSARVLTEIDPHFIRLRSLTLGPKIPLWQVFHGEEAKLTRQTDVEVVAWKGRCIVHEQFSAKRLTQLRVRYPDAEMIVGYVNDQMISNQQTMLYEQSFAHLLKVGTAWRRVYLDAPPA